MLADGQLTIPGLRLCLCCKVVDRESDIDAILEPRFGLRFQEPVSPLPSCLITASWGRSGRSVFFRFQSGLSGSGAFAFTLGHYLLLLAGVALFRWWLGPRSR